MAKKRILNPDFVPYKQDKLKSSDVIGYVGGLPLTFGGNVNVPTNLNEVLESSGSGKVLRKELVPYKQDALTKDSVLARINGKALLYGGSMFIEGGAGGDVYTIHDFQGTNLFNKDAATSGVNLISSNGNTASNAKYTVSDYIPVKSGRYYSFKSRYAVVWYDSELNYVSAAEAESGNTVLCPDNASYMRFSFQHESWLPEYMTCNEGNVTMAWEPYESFPEIKPEYLTRMAEKKFGLEISTVKFTNEGISNPSNLCLIATRCIRSERQIPDYTGYLYLDINSQKLYYSNNTPDNPKYLCDWDKSKASNESCENYCATITADGDIIFLRNWQRTNPIVYPHTNYNAPYIVDLGTSKKPYGYLMGSSVVTMDDGSIVFGDYTPHKEADERNNDGRCIWLVSKPYSNPSNWRIAHEFKHVFYSSPISDQPDNEIGHIHAVNYDWYNDVMYCTTGDIDRHCRLWYSLDKGNTWQAVPGAVGDTQGNNQTIGQRWRFTNMIFLEEYVYWCTDSFHSYHAMYRVRRNEQNVIDASTLELVTQLEKNIPNGMSQATYATAYIREYNGLLIIDRAEPRSDGILDVKFYSFYDKMLYIIKSIKRAKTDASSLDTAERIGLPNQTTMQCQSQTGNFIMCGGGTVIRPHNTELFNNSRSNYVGALKLKVVKL